MTTNRILTLSRRIGITRSFLVLGVAAMALLTGCRSTPSGRVMDEAEGDVVGSRSAGAETFNRLIEGSAQKLLDRESARYPEGFKLSVAVMEVENATNEAVGDFLEQIFEVLDTVFEKSGAYDSISRRYVDAVLRDTRLRPSDLALPRNQRAFASALETQKIPVTHLLFPKLTSGTTTSGSTKQKDYILTLELLDIKTGRFDKESQRVRKEYQG